MLLSFRGNWSVDLQAGSEFGYKLLFVVLMAGIFAVLFQVGSSTALDETLLTREATYL